MGSKKKRKKQAINKKSFIDTVLSVFAYHPFENFNFKQVSHALNIHDKPSRDLVKEMLSKLVNKGAIIAVKRGKYKLNPDYISPGLTHSTIEGKVDMKQTGKAYIISKDVEQDVFIAPNNTNHALNGDEVKVQLFPKRKGRKLEGQITEILKRAKTEFVGNVEMNNKFAFLIPDVKNMPVDIYIPGEKVNNVKDGDKAVARITSWPEHMNNPVGEIVEVLGEPGNNEVEMNSILSEFDFPLRFPQKVEKEAKEISTAIPQDEKKKRKDFREVFTCTIDPKDAKDFDDALSLRKLDNGNWEVGIHIADVSHYVKPGSSIDKEALKRATSVYLVDRVVPMLPEKLSNEVCSLRPGEDKLAFSAVFEMDDEANVHSDWYGKTLIRSDRRYNYAEVQEIIETGEGKNNDRITVLQQLASVLREQRFKQGAINFKSSEVSFELDENGKPLSAFIKEQKESNQLIEEFMLLANRKVAERIGRKKGDQDPKTFIYRVHDEPNPDKLQQFSEFVNRLGYKLRLGSRSGMAQSFNDLFRQVEGKGEEVMIETIAVRTMAKAEYSTQNIGHYGLAFNYYTHFTSPIRRYPDLMSHRLLQQYLEKKPSVNPQEYEEQCIHASEMERKAIEAERASIKYKQAEYMLDKVGKEFEGLISGVSKWGIFVQLNETKAEGLVSMADMNDDFYILDDENYQIVGKRHKHVYKLGDPIRVKVKSIDLPKKQMDFLIV